MSGRLGCLAVVPARGGSKRIPRKNIKPFLGIPLMARTIAVLHDSGVFDRIVVSTDDDEIADVAIRAGAEVPFRRPDELANDTTATIPVISHAILALESLGWRGDLCCCAYPAAVLTRPGDYRTAFDMLRLDPPPDYVFTATSFPHPIQRALRSVEGGGAEMFWPEHRQTRSQDLEPAFHDAGQFYFGLRDAWTEARPLFSSTSQMLVLPRYRVQDIDTQEDWDRAEMLARILMNESP